MSQSFQGFAQPQPLSFAPKPQQSLNFNQPQPFSYAPNSQQSFNFSQPPLPTQSSFSFNGETKSNYESAISKEEAKELYRVLFILLAAPLIAGLVMMGGYTSKPVDTGFFIGLGLFLFGLVAFSIAIVVHLVKEYKHDAKIRKALNQRQMSGI